MLTRSSHHLGSRDALHRLLASLVALGMLFLLVSDVAQARPLELSVIRPQRLSLPDVTVKVGGAHNARTISLYVDGRLRQRDRRRPWSFRHRGRLRLGVGHHRIAVVARFQRRRQVRRRTVILYRKQERQQKTHEAVSSSEPATTTTTTTPTGSIFWHGDYETGDLSQWEMIQRVAADRITVTQDPVRQGNYAARFEVRPTDNIGNTSPRAEVAADLGEREGEERYYRWYTYFEPSFPTNYPESFITFTQWRADDESGSYSSFMVWGDQIELRREGTRWATTLTKGIWHKFVYHVKWSPDPNVGFIELWYDNQLVLPLTHVRTMAGSPGAAVGNYVKQGLYKSEEIPTGVLYQDGLVSGTSFEAVSNAP